MKRHNHENRTYPRLNIKFSYCCLLKRLKSHIQNVIFTEDRARIYIVRLKYNYNEYYM